MIRRVSEKHLTQLVHEIAIKTRHEIDEAKLRTDDFQGVADKYDVTLSWEELPLNNPGYYSKDKRKIVLNRRIRNQEHLNFTFYHELTHHFVEHDDEILTLLADAYIASDYETVERMCNTGAAELLMPSDDVRQMILIQGFSTALIPKLCERYNASGIAVAFQMVNCASHNCYLVIAETQLVYPSSTEVSMVEMKSAHTKQERLIIIYSGRSSPAQYSIKRNQTVPMNHMLHEALHTHKSVYGDAKLPFASGNGWDVPCDALHFRGKVFAFFNVSPPMSASQLSLF